MAERALGFLGVVGGMRREGWLWLESSGCCDIVKGEGDACRVSRTRRLVVLSMGHA